MNTPSLACPTRRALLQAAGAAATTLTLGFRVGPTLAQATTQSAAFAPNAWLRIEPSGAVTVVISKTEMGQGTETGIAMILADELDADWARVAVRTAQPDGQRFMITGGSYSTAGAWDAGRKAAAAAREMLLAAGAQALGVSAADCRTEAHTVVHAASGRRVGYGELVVRAAGLPVPANPVLKPPAAFTLVGKPLPAKNLHAIVRAQAVYGMDVRVPGMLFAVIERSPVVNGRIARVDDRAARAVPGVLKVVTLRGNNFPTLTYVRDGVAVVARSTWAAMQGRRALKLQWNETNIANKSRNGALASSESLSREFDLALSGPAEVPRPSILHPRVTAARHGSAEGMEAAFKGAAKKLALRYDVPLQAHVPMEPMNAVAHWTPEACTVWAPSHFQSRLHASVCVLTGLPPDKVSVHTPLLGGSFGRRLDPDYALEAVMLSRELQQPVQVVWTREDDIRCGLYSPATRHQVRVALNAAGDILALDHEVAALSVMRQQEPDEIRAGLDTTITIDAVKFPYAAPQLHVSHRIVEQTIRVFWWRRGYTPNNTFANECVLDECAHAAGVDPLAYRLKLLGAPRELKFANGDDQETIHTGRLARVLQTACDAAGWATPAPPGTGRGLASTVTDSYVAQVVEVQATGHGGFKVTRVVTAVDCGRVVNPQLVHAQVEGSIVFALTATLKGAITVKDGRIEQGNFNDYPLLRIDETPRIDTVLLESDASPTGIGEPASHAVAAAVANAVFAATGQRLRSLPLARQA
jgi:isoquinoline 1-oxidoreductase beta subunit